MFRKYFHPDIHLEFRHAANLFCTKVLISAILFLTTFDH